jgi:hypothetical protein
MASRFYFAILEKGTNKLVVASEPRDSRDLIDKFADRLGERGVGWFHGTKRVQQHARDVLDELFFELKAKVQPHED